MQTPNLLTEKQSAERAKVSLETIREYCKSGLLKAIYKGNETHFNEREVVSMFHVEPEIPLPDFSAVAADLKAADPVPGEQQVPPDVRAEQIHQAEKIEPEIYEEVKSGEKDRAAEILVAVNANAELTGPVSTLREQIEILKDERDWLRRQLERMESQFEREQMLLLSNSETLRRVVNTGESKANFWNFLLPWRWNTKPMRRALQHER